MKTDVEERKLPQMAKVHNFLDMWLGNENLHATWQQSPAQYMLMTMGSYISDTAAIVQASWSPFRHDGAAAFTLSEPSPLPPAVSAKDLPGGETEMINVPRSGRINRHAVTIDKDCITESILDTEDWPGWYGDLENPTDSEDDWVPDIESKIQQSIAARIQNAQHSGMYTLCQMFPDWFGLHRSQRDRLRRYLWRSMQSTSGGIRERRKCRMECINV